MKSSQKSETGRSANEIVRRARKAGSWYEANPELLSSQLEGWLASATKTQQNRVKAIIAPHAGYSYSGPTAAWAYKHLDAERISRIFLLGPSHHAYIEKPALSNATHYETPLGNITLDLQTMSQLEASGQFVRMSLEVDEDEHSLELHLPYIVKAMRGRPFTLVPIMVGHLDTAEQMRRVAAALAPHVQRDDTLFVISSDFCHWGKRFSFTRYDRSAGEIHQSIEAMDRAGMQLIESQDIGGWEKYLSATKNTICGRFPITLLLYTLAAARSGLSAAVRFVAYAQSSQCKSERDSSVSYASAVITQEP